MFSEIQRAQRASAILNNTGIVYLLHCKMLIGYNVFPCSGYVLLFKLQFHTFNALGAKQVYCIKSLINKYYIKTDNLFFNDQLKLLQIGSSMSNLHKN